MIAQALKSIAASVADAGAGPKVAHETAAAVDVDKSTQTAQSDATVSDAVKAAAAQIDSYLKNAGRDMEFRVDEQSHITVVTIREAATGKVIRQIPNEEVLRLARSLGFECPAGFEDLMPTIG